MIWLIVRQQNGRLFGLDKILFALKAAQKELS